MELRDRTAVVTGASSGIGAATARAFARHGARIVLLARTAALLDAAAGEIAEQGGVGTPYPVDLADAQAVDTVGRRILDDIGTPDVVVNIAGAGRWLFVEETPPDEAVAMMSVPYFAAFFVTRAFLPSMLDRGSGHIVNITSAAALAPWPGATAYTAARWAMRGFGESLRQDLRGTGVGVSLVVAGKTTSPYWAHNPGAEDRVPRIARIVPTLTSDDVAAAIVRAVVREKPRVIVPGTLHALSLVHRVLPSPVEWVISRTGHRHSTPRRAHS